MQTIRSLILAAVTASALAVAPSTHALTSTDGPLSQQVLPPPPPPQSAMLGRWGDTQVSGSIQAMRREHARPSR